MCVFPTPGRAVQQQPALEVLAGRTQRLAVPGHADDLAAYVVERRRREDQLVLAQGLAAVEPQERALPPEHRPAEGDDLAAVDVVLHGEVGEAGGDLGPGTFPRGDHLDRGLLTAVLGVGSAEEEGAATVGIAHQEHRDPQALLGLALRPRGERRAQHVARPRSVLGLLRQLPEQVGQPHRAPVPVAGHADQPVLAAGLPQPGVQRRLHVDVLVRRPLLLGDRQPVGGQAEVLGEHRAELRPVGLAGLVDEAGHQPPAVATDVGQLGPGLFAHAADPRDATGRTGVEFPSGRQATA